ncbi:hypothetical protein SRABI80_01612 [Peribacillus frigoritolerans]|nr:hypothetical protein SRABI80_01612 [Peribacillus frigoritolerans]
MPPIKYAMITEGPAISMAELLPLNKPAPMAPPNAIIVICLEVIVLCKFRLSVSISLPPKNQKKHIVSSFIIK